MGLLIRRPAWVRIAPFALFILLLALRGAAPADGAWGFDPRWIYAAGVVLVGALVVWYWREYGELARQTWPDARELLLAVAVGLAVFGLWIQLDAGWMTIGEPAAKYVPLTDAGALDWPRILVRCVGAALLVPLIEELFWRSFLMRWLERPVFEGVDPQRVGLKAIMLSTFVFTLAHTLWLARTFHQFADSAVCEAERGH